MEINSWYILLYLVSEDTNNILRLLHPPLLSELDFASARCYYSYRQANPSMTHAPLAELINKSGFIHRVPRRAKSRVDVSPFLPRTLQYRPM